MDLWLERRGMLRRLERAEQLVDLAPRRVRPRSPEELRERGTAIEDMLVRETLAAGGIRTGEPDRRVLVPA